MALALKLGADGQLQQLQDGDSLVADTFNRISSSGDLVIGGNVTGGAEEVTIGAITSVVHVLGDTELDGLVTVLGTLVMSGQDITGAKTITFGEPVSQTTSGATLTIDCSTGNKHRITLASNITTIVLTNALGATNITIEFVQNGTGSFTVTGWPARVLWLLNVEPVFGDGANAVRLVSFYWNGPTFDDYIGEFNAGTYS